MKQKVKEALSACSGYKGCDDCPFEEEKFQCINKLLAEASKTITQLDEENELLQAELTKAHDEAVKDFAHFLIDNGKSEGGIIFVADLPDLVMEWREAAEKEGAEE